MSDKLAGNSAGTARLRGTGRPFQPGRSGNPSGRPARVGHLAATIQAATRDGKIVVDLLMSVLQDKDARDADRIVAARELLDRGFGKATQPTGEISDAEFCEMARGIARAKGYDEQAFVDRSLENRRLARAQGYGR